MHPLPFHLGLSQSAKYTRISADGDTFRAQGISQFVLQSPFGVWCYGSEASIPALLSQGSEGARALCILGNAAAIGGIEKVNWESCPFW